MGTLHSHSPASSNNHSLPAPSNLTREVCEAAGSLLEDALGTSGLPVRLLGVGMSGLEPQAHWQQTLFEVGDRERESRLDAIRDEIHARFGAASLQRGSTLSRESEEG